MKYDIPISSQELEPYRHQILQQIEQPNLGHGLADGDELGLASSMTNFRI
jgi:hypothetical protein